MSQRGLQNCEVETIREGAVSIGKGIRSSDHLEVPEGFCGDLTSREGYAMHCREWSGSGRLLGDVNVTPMIDNFVGAVDHLHGHFPGRTSWPECKAASGVFESESGAGDSNCGRDCERGGNGLPSYKINRQ